MQFVSILVPQDQSPHPPLHQEGRFMRLVDDLTSFHNRWLIVAVAGQMPRGVQMFHQSLEQIKLFNSAKGLVKKKKRMRPAMTGIFKKSLK